MIRNKGLKVHFFALMLTLAGCSSGQNENDAPIASKVTINTQISAISDGTAVDKDNIYGRLDAYMFTDGKLSKVIPISGPNISIEIDRSKQNKVHFIARDEAQFPELKSMVVGQTAYATLAAMKSGANTSALGAAMFMQTVVEIGSSDTQLNAVMQRGVARLDLNSANSEVTVSQIRIAKSASESSLLPATANTAGFTSYDIPISPAATGLIPAVAYLYEHKGVSDCTVEVDAHYQGVATTLTATLPTNVERNKIYKVKVINSTGKLECTISIAPWGVGEEVDATPQGIKVDRATSIVHDTIAVDYDNSHVTLSGWGGKFTLGFTSATPIEIVPEGAVPGIHYKSVPNSANQFQFEVDAQSWNNNEYTARLGIKSVLDEHAYDFLSITVKRKPFKIPSVAFDDLEFMSFNTRGRDPLDQTSPQQGETIQDVYDRRFADAMGYFTHWGRANTFMPWANTSPNLTPAGPQPNWGVNQELVPCPNNYRIPTKAELQQIIPEGTVVPSRYMINNRQYSISVTSPSATTQLPSGARVYGRYLTVANHSTGQKLFLPMSGYKGDKVTGVGREMGDAVKMWVSDRHTSGGWAQALIITGGAKPTIAYSRLEMEAFGILRCVRSIR